MIDGKHCNTLQRKTKDLMSGKPSYDLRLEPTFTIYRVSAITVKISAGFSEERDKLVTKLQGK